MVNGSKKGTIMNKNEEQILVVKREHILPKPVHGFVPISKFNKNLEKALQHIEVKRRGDMEEDPTYKQLISYVVVKNDKDEVLVYTRLKGGGESRLHGQSSIGVGGHMNPSGNLEGDQLLLENTYRELEEEIGVKPEQLGLIGVINDDTNPVGEVHIGLVYLANIGSQTIHITETDTLKVEFVKTFENREYETWSQLIIDAHVI